MSDERLLSFKQRQELFNAKLNLNVQGSVPIPLKSPRLPPRRSVPNESSHAPKLPPRQTSVDEASIRPSEDAKPPKLPPRRQSCSSKDAESSSEDCPFVHVSERKNTRKAVRLKKKQNTVRTDRETRSSTNSVSPSPFTEPCASSPESVKRSPPTMKRADSPSTMKRADSPSTMKRADSPDTIKRAASPTTLECSVSLNEGSSERRDLPLQQNTSLKAPDIKVSDSTHSQNAGRVLSSRPPPSPPSSRKRLSVFSTADSSKHRQSMPPSEPVYESLPSLPLRRKSYDDKILLEKTALKTKISQGSHYQYARQTGPPPKPPDKIPYRIKNQPSPTQRSRTSLSSSIYMVDAPPTVKLATHPRLKDTCKHSSSSPPEVRIASSQLANIIIPTDIPPPIPKTLPPSLNPPADKNIKSISGQSAEDSPTQLVQEEDQSEYDDDDDIYGQIAADLDEISYEKGNDFFIIQKSVPDPPPQASKSGFREYWHERKEVIESGILESDQLSKTERARQEAMYEIFTSEETYKKSLDTLEKQFINDNLFACYLDEFPEGLESVLSNIEEIISVSNKLLEELKALYEGQVTVDSITDILRKFADSHFPAFVTYCANTANQQDVLSRQRAEDPDFEKFLTDREVCLSGQNLQSFLILPMQRICRMPLLLDAVNKKTEEDSPDKKPLTSLHKDICEIVDKCNEGVRCSENRKNMENLDRKCDFSKIKLKNFSDKSDRLIIKEGVVMFLKFKSGKKMGSKINMWLFTDCLIIGFSDPKDESKLILTEHSPRQLVKVSPHFFPPASYKKKIEVERVFHLQLLSPDKKFIIQCESATEKKQWMEVLRKKETDNEDETIYEEWDVPIVQAKHHYEKINEDDLELSEGEVCRVLKKYTDGWCFGQRQSDGAQGWFPMSFMEEVTSEHTKYREILQKQLLLEKIVSNEKSTLVFSTMRKT